MADEHDDDRTDSDDPDVRSAVEEKHTSARRAKEEAAEQSIDPATWRSGGVGIDP